MDFPFKITKSPKTVLRKTKPLPSQLTSLPKYILYQIANQLPFIDLSRFSTVNRQCYDRLYKSPDYWGLRYYAIRGVLPERSFTRNDYYVKFCTLRRIDYPAKEIAGRPVISDFKKVDEGKMYTVLIDFDNTLRVSPTRNFTFSRYKMLNVKSIICSDDYILILTQDNKLYVDGPPREAHLFTDQTTSFGSPTLILSNVTKINIGKYNAILWRGNNKIYQVDVTHKPVGRYVSKMTCTPLSISATLALPFGCGDLVFVTANGHMYFKSEYGHETPKFISDHVKHIYVQEPYVYWINKQNVLWQANLVTWTAKRQIMDRVYRLVCNRACLWVLTLETNLYRIPCSAMNMDLEEVSFVCNGVCNIEGHDNHVVVKKVT